MNKMFGFIKKVFVVAMTFFGCNALKCVLMNNQECKIRPQIININSNEPSFYPYTIKIYKCGGSCNNINDPYAKLCVPDVVKNMNFKVFILISRTNETRHVKWLETCKCKCALDAIVCNNKQRWNKDKCRCKCKELIDKGSCEKRFIWSPSNCGCECDKSCDTREYLDYENSKCTKELVDKLVEECSKYIDGNEMIYNDFLSVCNFYTIYIILFVMKFLIIIRISSAYFCFHWYLKKNNAVINVGANTEALVY